MNNWTNEDLKKKGFAQINGGNYEQLKKHVVKSGVKKIVPTINSFNLILDVREDTPVTIFIKPLSANKAYKGKIYKTEYHKNYCVALACLLPRTIFIPDGLLKAYYEFGFSSKGGDLDNPIKIITDVIARKYGFNDNRIMEANIKKVIVPKGKEYIRFKFEAL